MTSKTNWTQYPRLDRRVVELLAESNLTGELLYAYIAKTLTEEFHHLYGVRFTPDSVRSRIRRINFDNLNNHPVTVLMPYYEKYAHIIDHNRSTEAPPEKIVNGRSFKQYLNYMKVGTKKTLVLSDFHIPYQNEELIQQAINRNLTADLIVINGDLFDINALSTFVKTEDAPIYAEIDGGVRMLEYLSKLFPDSFIIITQGNHENRVGKRIRPAIPSGLDFLVDTDFINKLAKPFNNIVVENDWFIQIGDAIYAHAEAASGVAAKPAVDTLDWFITHQSQLNLEPFRLVVQAHTHRVAVVYRNQYKTIESGSLCHEMNYSRTTKYRFPQMNGYVVTIQKDGISDFYLTREFTV